MEIKTMCACKTSNITKINSNYLCVNLLGTNNNLCINNVTMVITPVLITHAWFSFGFVNNDQS